MPYVIRREDGRIRAVVGEGDTDGAELLPLDAPELIAFLGGVPAEAGNPLQDLALSDLVMIRVLEDLIDLLVAKGVILYTDLPAVAQRKLRERIDLRRRAGARLDLAMPDQDSL